MDPVVGSALLLPADIGPCHNLFHLAINFKFVAAKILLQWWRQDKGSVTNSPDIITISLDSLVTKLYDIQTYFDLPSYIL